MWSGTREKKIQNCLLPLLQAYVRVIVLIPRNLRCYSSWLVRFGWIIVPPWHSWAQGDLDVTKSVRQVQGPDKMGPSEPAVAGEEKVGGPSHYLRNICREEVTMFSGNAEMLSICDCADWTEGGSQVPCQVSLPGSWKVQKTPWLSDIEWPFMNVSGFYWLQFFVCKTGELFPQQIAYLLCKDSYNEILTTKWRILYPWQWWLDYKNHSNKRDLLFLFFFVIFEWIYISLGMNHSKQTQKNIV